MHTSPMVCIYNSDKLERSKKYVSFNLTETKHVKSLKTFINLVDTDTSRTLTHTHVHPHTPSLYIYTVIQGTC